MGDPEVGDERDPVGEQDVLGLDVAVDQAVVVRMAQRARHLPGKPQRLVQRQLTLACEAGTQRFPLDVGHHIEEVVAGRAGVEERNDVRMIQPGRDLDLAQESILADGRHQRRFHQLDGDEPIVFDVLGEVDSRHPAAADFADHAIAAKHRRCHWSGLKGIGWQVGAPGVSLALR